MSVPVIYYGNALLSGTLGAELGGAASTLPRVRDGSITLPYILTESGTTSPSRVGEVNLTLPAAISTTDRALIFPRCDLEESLRVRLYSRATSGAAASTQANEILAERTRFYLQDFLVSGQDHAFFEIQGVSRGTASGYQYVNEIVIAQKYTLPRSPEVSVTRAKVRQFNRLDVPGSEPFTRRTGPMLRRTSMNFVVLSGSEIDALRGFIDGVEGGSAFTLTDDLGVSYWSELIDADVPEQDEAGVSSVTLTFQEIRVDDE